MAFPRRYPVFLEGVSGVGIRCFWKGFLALLYDVLGGGFRGRFLVFSQGFPTSFSVVFGGRRRRQERIATHTGRRNEPRWSRRVAECVLET